MRELIKKILNESVPPQVRRRQGEFDRIFLHYRDSFIGHEYKFFKSFWNVTFEATMETLYHAWFSKTVKDDDWEESAEYIENYHIIIHLFCLLTQPQHALFEHGHSKLSHN